MRTYQYVILASLGLLLLAGLSSGCTPGHTPSQEAVLDYLRSARVHGKVRRAWAGGQEYVDGILKADAKLQTELDALRAYTSVDALWPHADPRWQDEEVIATSVEHLTDLCEGRRVRRQILLRELAEAIDQVPADLKLETDEAKAAFTDRVWGALRVMGVDLRNGDVIHGLEEHAGEFLGFMRAVQGAAGAFDKDRFGLNVTDTAQQAALDKQYAALQARLTNTRDAFVINAETALAEIAPRLREVDRKQARSEYEYLTYRSAFMKNGLQAMVKRLQAAMTQATEELEGLRRDLGRADEKAKPKIAAKIAAVEEHMERSQTDLDVLAPRVKAAVTGFDEASRPDVANEDS